MSSSATTISKPKPRSIVFFHPDLGIGGAERLIIDAAVSLQKLGHKVTIYTNYRNKSHCFDEARDGTLDVRVRGDTIFPPTILSKFKILLTILRHYHLLYQIWVSGELEDLKADVFFLDLLSAGVPILRYLYPSTRILFYCHFPDRLLVQNRKAWYRKIWRLPFDALESWGMRGADRVMVNSNFTKGVVQGIWSDLGGDDGVTVVYPCIDINAEQEERERFKGVSSNGSSRPAPTQSSPPRLWPSHRVILSINRFERKKNIALAIRAFATLPPPQRANARLVLAGGYDPANAENISYHTELVDLASELGLQAATARNIVSASNIPEDIQVLFLLSVPGALKQMLLNTASLLVYTPANEHFGIVPLEAMLAGVPVLAADSGGPRETVKEEETGWLRDTEDVGTWSEVIGDVLRPSKENDRRLEKMGEDGKEWVKRTFGRDEMGVRLQGEMDAAIRNERVKVRELYDVVWGISTYALGASLAVGFMWGYSAWKGHAFGWMMAAVAISVYGIGRWR